MSEFGIEEKANAYDIALKKAKTLLSKCKCDRDRITMIYRVEDIESIFPELKEFSDKEIKKWLIGYFQQYKSDGIEEFGNGLKVTDVISWLEKQNEPSIKWNENTKENKPPIYHSILMKTTHGIAEGEWRGECWCQYRWSTNHIKDSDVLAWMELSDLDKSLDKIEPKFKVNDWIVINGFNILITDIYNGSYDTILESGEYRIYDIDVIDKDAHLWSINDAKEGDILITENEKPFIYKGFLDKIYSNKPVAYGGIVDSGYFSPCSNNCTNRWTDGDVYPATQEQRNLLFREIKEAGYKWNSDEKQLIRVKKQ